jgi:tetratricopeptide (TPR) repeat protein
MTKILTYFATASILIITLAGCGPDRRSTTQILNAAVESGSKNNWKEALELAMEAARREPENSSAWLMLAIAYENNARKDLAIQTARKAVKCDPDNFLAQYILGRLYFETPDKIQDSVQPLLSALKLKPDDPNILILLGQVYRRLNIDKPEQFYERLAKTKRFKDRPEPWNEMGVIYAARNDSANTAKCLVKAYYAAPDNHTTVLNLAICMDRHGRKSKAISFYKKYLNLIANNPELEHQRQRIRHRIRELSS